MGEEMGDAGDIGSWGQRHGVRGRGADAGRGLRVLAADANSRPDHVGHRAQLGHQEPAHRCDERPHVHDNVHHTDEHTSRIIVDVGGYRERRAAALRGFASEAAADFDLSFLQARALRRLEQPMATGTLAEQLGLDRSNVTGVIDRLEERGLITRQPHPGDRRVKLVVLTDAGRATRAAIDERIFATVTLFEALSEEDQRDLAGLLSKLLERADAGASAPVVQ